MKNRRERFTEESWKTDCPVCGYPRLQCDLHTGAGVASEQICPCCFFHFGYHDAFHGTAYAEYRAAWIMKGMPWMSRRAVPPDEWSPAAQLRAAGITLTHDLDLLAAPPVSQWRVAQVIGSGWYDGLTHGFCVVTEPRCSIGFELLGCEAPGHGSQTRLFQLYGCSWELTEMLVSRLDRERGQEPEALGSMGSEVRWFPVDSPDQAELDDLLARLNRSRVLLPVVAEAHHPFQMLRLWFSAAQA